MSYKQNLPENSDYGSEIPKRLDTHFTVKLLTELARLTALSVLLPRDYSSTTGYGGGGYWQHT